MKIIRILPVLGAILLSLGLGASVAAEGLRIRIVDMQQVGMEYQRYGEAQRQLETRKEQLQRVVDDEEQSVMALTQEYEAIRATASAEELARRRGEIEKRDQELREFVAQSNMQFRDELDSLYVRTRNEIESVVTSIAQREKYDIILEKNMTLFNGEALDVTATVIAELNRVFPPLPAASTLPRRDGAAANRDTATPPTAFPAPPPASERRGWPFR